MTPRETGGPNIHEAGGLSGGRKTFGLSSLELTGLDEIRVKRAGDREGEVYLIVPLRESFSGI